MSIMKGHVRNRADPQCSMIEENTTEEVFEFYNDYNEYGKLIDLSVSRHEAILFGKGTIGKRTYNDDNFELVSQAHSYLLQQLQVVESYIQQHLQQLCDQNGNNYSEDSIMKEHKRNFSKFLKNQNLSIGETREEQIMYLWLRDRNGQLQYDKHMILMTLHYILGKRTTRARTKIEDQRNNTTR